MLYQKNTFEALKKELFQNPTSEYRGTPFWAWNCKLDEQTALKQIDCFKEMGLGGFHIHSRAGLDTEYMGDEFLEIVKSCSDKAEKENMLCWLYDEDRWPSGAAGGFVTKNPNFRARKLLFSPYEMECVPIEQGGPVRLLARYAVWLKDGFLDNYRQLAVSDESAEDCDVWYAYLEVDGTSPWFNNQAYADTLNKKAIDEFITQTHEKYYKLLGDRFSKSVPAIFTDEPQFSRKDTLWYANEKRQIRIPYTDDLEETYKAEYGESLLAHLPELFWELSGGEASVTRYRYHDHTAERFARAFADNIGNWCEKHNIMLTGHMMEEPTLHSQTAVLGDTMRSYRGFQLPGIDMLCGHREYTTAKQAQSAAHQYGCCGVLSEIYGVTNWDFDFRGHKLHGDWQAALGVTVRVQHLAWMSMAGESKRDYPASIFYQSPWYQDYSFIEDHFARVNTAMVRGKPHVRVGVIHPVESFWLHYGTNEKTAQIRSEMERHFADITQWMLFGLIDFDFIAESLLPSQCKKLPESNQFSVGEMNYDTIIVPDCETIRKTTLERLEAFVKNGGKVIFAGQIPAYVDAVPSDAPKRLAADCVCVPFTQGQILEAVEDLRTVEITNQYGQRSNNFLYQMRCDKNSKWLFVANGRGVDNEDICSPSPMKITVKGNFSATVYDTMTGEIYPVDVFLDGGNTVVNYTFNAHDSLLLKLDVLNTETKAIGEKSVKHDVTAKVRLDGPVDVVLSEPNVLLLDMAEYKFDDDVWQKKEEILRIDNLFRQKLDLPLRQDHFAQPWVVEDSDTLEHILSLKFRFMSDVRVEGPYLALENPEHTKISVNGEAVSSNIDGWFTDECIKKVKLPPLPVGESVIRLDIEFNRKTNVEWCYLLGDFGVELLGDVANITEPVRQLRFGDWTRQGLPFYAGNVTYCCKTKLPSGLAVLRASKYRGAALKASLDGGKEKVFGFAPYTVELGEISQGEHKIAITVLGSRINAFGQVHNCDDKYVWFGPNSWRTEGDSWSYEYRTWRLGILKAPEIEIFN